MQKFMDDLLDPPFDEGELAIIGRHFLVGERPRPKPYLSVRHRHPQRGCRSVLAKSKKAFKTAILNALHTHFIADGCYTDQYSLYSTLGSCYQGEYNGRF